MTTSIYTPYNKSNKEKFSNKSIDLYGDKYDYSKVEYINNRTKVTITCNKHNNTFEQVPCSHFKYEGCSECLSESKRNTKESFIKTANNVHNNKYDYSKSVYIDTRTKIEIIYPNHGSFLQSPNVHTAQKSGCRKCYDEKSKWRVELSHSDAQDICYLYNIKLTGNGEIFYKWGIAKDLQDRHRRITEVAGYKIELISVLIDTRINCDKVERKLKKKYKRYRYNPINTFGGYTECYKK